MNQKCELCQALPVLEDGRFTKDEDKYNAFSLHRHLELIDSSSDWSETTEVYLCRICQSIYGVYRFHPFNDDPNEYTFTTLPKEGHFLNDSVWSLVNYALSRYDFDRIEKRKKLDGYTTIYTNAHVDDFIKWKNGESLSIYEARKDVYESFTILLNRYWLPRWSANQRYFLRTTVPNASLYGSWERVDNSLSGTIGGFDLCCTHEPTKEEIEVFDPLKNEFIHLIDWDIPPVYDQKDKRIDFYYERYEALKEKGYAEYEEYEKVREKKGIQLVKDMFRIDLNSL